MAYVKDRVLASSSLYHFSASPALKGIKRPQACLLLVWAHPVRRPRLWGPPKRYDWTSRWALMRQEIQRRCEWRSVVLWAPLFQRGRSWGRRYTGSRQYAAFLASRLLDILDDLLPRKQKPITPAAGDGGCETYDLVLEGVGTGGLALRAMAAVPKDLWEGTPYYSTVSLLQQRLHRLRKQGKVALRSILFDNTPHAGTMGRGPPGKEVTLGASAVQWLLYRLPAFITEGALRIGDRVELFHADKDRLLCRLAQTEKQDYVQGKGGSLLSLFQSVLVYGHLNETRAPVSPHSALGLSHRRLGASKAYQLISDEPYLQSRYFYINALQSSLNRLAWGPQGNPARGPLAFYTRRLFYDKDICLRESPSHVPSLTLELLEAVNPKQQRHPFTPYRYAMYTGEDFYRGPYHPWGPLVPDEEETNENAAWVAHSHQRVRSLQTPREQKKELIGDRMKEVVDNWWQW